ncbi:uncharacterized protein CEXT_100481 [Caerostris extrusa]|uniref:Secreted protein n=1 Tax=Caerostris extrusa TaxID=172846 RepID=A0AAV4NJQ1_CAEEX|nr:uncharacterized protein CEXT_100481 [Caerostris extrusa]
MVHLSNFLFAFLFVLQGSSVLCFFQHCDNSRCKNPELLRELEQLDYMPTTEEQLNNLCPQVEEFLQCNSDVLERCTGKSLIELAASDNKTVSAIGHVVRSIRSIVNDICDSNSAFHQKYLNGIQCFKDLSVDPAPTLKCHQEGHAVYATYANSMALLGEKEDALKEESESWCMITAYTLACFASELHDTCGEEARNIFVDVLKLFKPLKLNECSETNVQDLRTKFIDFLELEDDQRSIYSSVFDTRKRRK